MEHWVKPFQTDMRRYRAKYQCQVAGYAIIPMWEECDISEKIMKKASYEK